VLAFILGLLSKPMLVTLPFVLLLLDYWPLRRLSGQTVLEKVPLLAIAFLVAAISIAAVAEVSAGAVPDPIPPTALVANAVVSCVRYLWLTLWPVGLSPWYSHPWFEGPPLTGVEVTTATIVLVGACSGTLALAARFPYAPVGWFWYLGTLVPVLGLVYNGRQGMADRYAYIPHIGLFVASVWAVADLPVRRALAVRAVEAGALGVLLLALGMLTERQTRIWKNDRTFWEYTARTNRYSFIANQALAGMMQGDGRVAEATVYYRRAIRLRPELAPVHVQFGRLLARTGRTKPAAAQFRKAVALQPSSVEYRLGLGQVLQAAGRRRSARRQFEEVLRLRPDHAEARRALDSMGAPGSP
jgi:hypothetical protein